MQMDVKELLLRQKTEKELIIHAGIPFASGGIGGCYELNFPHLTGDESEISKSIILSWNIWIMYRYIRQHCIRKNREEVS